MKESTNVFSRIAGSKCRYKRSRTSPLDLAYVRFTSCIQKERKTIKNNFWPHTFFFFKKNERPNKMLQPTDFPAFLMSAINTWRFNKIFLYPIILRYIFSVVYIDPFCNLRCEMLWVMLYENIHKTRRHACRRGCNTEKVDVPFATGKHQDHFINNK